MESPVRSPLISSSDRSSCCFQSCWTFFLLIQRVSFTQNFLFIVFEVLGIISYTFPVPSSSGKISCPATEDALPLSTLLNLLEVDSLHWLSLGRLTVRNPRAAGLPHHHTVMLKTI